MGRHSAPDDDEDVESATGAETAPAHATDTQTPPPAEKRESGGTADLRLLRENPNLRARCAAAVIVPFVIYTLVMIVIGRVGLYLLWVWVPTVLAGVLVGMFLDRAHKANASD